MTNEIAKKNDQLLQAKKLNTGRVSALLTQAEKIKVLCPLCRHEFSQFQEDISVKNSTDSIRKINAVLLEQGKQGIEVLN